MNGTSNLALILDDLAVIKEHLNNLNRAELAALGAELVSLTDATRAAYRGAQYTPASAPVAQTPLYLQRYECGTCGRTWTASPKVLAGTPPIVKTCGLCVAQTRAQMPVPTAALTSLGQMTPAVEDGAEEMLSTGGLIDGTYTVVFGNGDQDYITLKIATQPLDAEFAPGKTTAAYLNGPDNYRNYKGFAFVNNDGTYNLYRKFATSNPNPQTEMALRVLLGSHVAMIEGFKAYGLRSGKCGVCGHKLTTKRSLELGIGPICAGRLGL